MRRPFIFLERSIDESTPWVVFEPNDDDPRAREACPPAQPAFRAQPAPPAKPARGPEARTPGKARPSAEGRPTG